ncbi:hypothetical protein ABR738_01220 [Streptomyces sp. Edi4]|uniref:hypothetical protein n=1 Tax=Streptomyces sp. Edi4 TaxID=3162527 RepID=UPI0033061E15
MAKNPPAPTFTLQAAAPVKPGLWQAHRHQVLSVLALTVGFLLGTHANDSTNAAEQRPPHTTTVSSHDGR